MSLQNIIISITLLVSFPLLLVKESPPDIRQAEFVIEDQSELKLSGSSNVNKFTCECECYSESTEHSFSLYNSNPKAVTFDNTTLKLETAGMDCGHRGINRDLYELLKVKEHPFITIELLSANQLSPESLTIAEGWVPISANTAITIAGVCREVTMNISAKKLSDKRYRFSGSKDLYMSDFKLTPPKHLLGLIKVDEEIEIQLDLYIRMIASD